MGIEQPFIKEVSVKSNVLQGKCVLFPRQAIAVTYTYFL
mgnify:CR=1 FL=1